MLWSLFGHFDDMTMTRRLFVFAFVITPFEGRKCRMKCPKSIELARAKWGGTGGTLQAEHKSSSA